MAGPRVDAWLSITLMKRDALAFDAKLQKVSGNVSSWSIQREAQPSGTMTAGWAQLGCGNQHVELRPEKQQSRW